MGLFSGIGKVLFGSAPNLAGESEAAFKREQERLREEKKQAALAGKLALSGGIGTSRKAEFSFGDADETDLDLTDEFTNAYKRPYESGVASKPLDLGGGGIARAIKQTSQDLIL